MFGEEFFPTPRNVIDKMLAKVSKDAQYFLEPSAGKGDIAEAIFRRGSYHYASRGDESKSKYKIDCIESQPDLASILSGKSFPVVGYDWLTYSGVCYYDAILMNPPFSNGDEHILKAWDFMHHGEIVCLLNEETIKNPYTARRQLLAGIIAEHGTVEYLGDCFSVAERKTAVNVALVYLKKVSQDDTIDMWASVNEEREVSGDIGDDPELPALRDQLGNMQHYFDAANEHMLKAFTHMRKARLYMAANKIGGKDFDTIVALGLGNSNTARSEFIRKHRHDAWSRVFSQMQFHRWLDKKQRDKFLADIERDTNAPFTKENIKATLQNVFAQRSKLFEQSVVNVFDALTAYHNENTIHTEGWKTNDSYKVNRKIVFPWGCRYTRYPGCPGSFDLYSMQKTTDIYDDLDRVVAVLAKDNFSGCECNGGGLHDGPAAHQKREDDYLVCSACGKKSVITIGMALRWKFQERGADHYAPNNKVESTYFRIKYWQKGTVHIEWKSEKLWQEFNVKASIGKRWIGTNTQRGDPKYEPQNRKAEPVRPKIEAAQPDAETEIRQLWTIKGIPVARQDEMLQELKNRKMVAVSVPLTVPHEQAGLFA